MMNDELNVLNIVTTRLHQADIPYRQPDISGLKIALFLKLYGDDFDKEQKQKIIAHLRAL